MNKGERFLKKLECCVSGEYNEIVLSTKLICKLATVKNYRADVSSASPSSFALTKG